MKPLILSLTLASLVLPVAAPVQAASKASSISSIGALLSADIDKRRKPRIPGGSGCDDPEDILEHLECQ